MVHVVFYIHQTGACDGVWACDCTHQIEKTEKLLNIRPVSNIENKFFSMSLFVVSLYS